MLNKTINSFKVFYSPKFPVLITYMLQSTEYSVLEYLKWFWSTDDFSKVQKRRELDKTLVARLILRTLRIGIVFQLLFGLVLIYLNIIGRLMGGWGLGLGIILLYPVFWSQIISIPVFLARVFYITPKEKKLILSSQKIFSSTKALKIAVLGSYGKTSMKELLQAVLSSKKKVAATPGNLNVASSHAKFARTLKGDEEIIILEFGEGKPGDIELFTKTFQPDIAVITGISGAHLDKYKTIDNISKDMFSVLKYVDKEKIYINADSSYLKKYQRSTKFKEYSQTGLGSFKVSNINSTIKGISFDLKSASTLIKIHSKLLGRHQIGPLSLVSVLALELGLKANSIEKAIARITPYEHRMSYSDINGAIVIDDSYNGNIEGMKAGLNLMRELKATRKIYVTPGLVDQGKQKVNVHIELGKLIAEAQVDLVVLMENSTTRYIEAGLKNMKFRGKLQIEKDPLFYYNNLKHFIASGDLVMLQYIE